MTEQLLQSEIKKNQQLAANLAKLKEVYTQLESEWQNKHIQNKLIKSKIRKLEKEKQKLLLALEQEEEFLTNQKLKQIESTIHEHINVQGLSEELQQILQEKKIWEQKYQQEAEPLSSSSESETSFTSDKGTELSDYELLKQQLNRLQAELKFTAKEQAKYKKLTDELKHQQTLLINENKQLGSQIVQKFIEDPYN